jgi:hypothetical protein
MLLDRIDHLYPSLSGRSEAQYGIRMDDSNTIFLKRQLTAVESKVYRKVYQDIVWSKLLPIQTDQGRGPKFFSFSTIDSTGEASYIEPGAGNLNLVQLTQDEKIGKYRTFGLKFQWTWDELDAANFAGFALQAELAIAARDKWERLLDQTVHFGDDSVGLGGLLSDPSELTEFVVPTTGTGSSKKFADKTGALMYDDCINFLNTASDTTDNAFPATVWDLPVAQFNRLAGTPMSQYDTRSVLKAVKENMEERGIELTINVCPKLKGVSKGSISNKDVMLCYAFSEEVAATKLPMPFTMFPMRESEEGNFVVPCWGRNGGVVKRHPKGIIYAAGI